VSVSAMKQALEAMESFSTGIFKGEFSSEIAALRQALAEPANSTTSVVEPVVWIEKHKDYLAVSADPFENAIPVYTSPLKCEWVELTHIEIGNLWAESQEVYSFAKAIEVKLKEKNT